MLSRWSDVAVTEPGFGIFDSWEERAQALTECFETFAGLWQARLAAGPGGNDLMSLLVFSDGNRDLSGAEFLGNLINLIAAGNDTTRNSLTGGMLALRRFPTECARLRANPVLTETTVPEIIRWQTSISHMARTAKSAFELGGATIRAGDRVALW